MPMKMGSRMLPVIFQRDDGEHRGHDDGGPEGDADAFRTEDGIEHAAAVQWQHRQQVEQRPDQTDPHQGPRKSRHSDYISGRWGRSCNSAIPNRICTAGPAAVTAKLCGRVSRTPEYAAYPPKAWSTISLRAPNFRAVSAWPSSWTSIEMKPASRNRQTSRMADRASSRQAHRR